MPRKKKPQTSNGDDANRKLEQTYIADMAPPKDEVLEDMAIQFVQARNAWQNGHQAMVEAKAELMQGMKERGFTEYEYNREGVDYVVKLDMAEQLHVRRKAVQSTKDE